MLGPNSPCLGRSTSSPRPREPSRGTGSSSAVAQVPSSRTAADGPAPCCQRLACSLALRLPFSAKRVCTFLGFPEAVLRKPAMAAPASGRASQRRAAASRGCTNGIMGRSPLATNCQAADGVRGRRPSRSAPHSQPARAVASTRLWSHASACVAVIDAQLWLHVAC